MSPFYTIEKLCDRRPELECPKPPRRRAEIGRNHPWTLNLAVMPGGGIYRPPCAEPLDILQIAKCLRATIAKYLVPFGALYFSDERHATLRPLGAAAGFHQQINDTNLPCRCRHSPRASGRSYPDAKASAEARNHEI